MEHKRNSADVSPARCTSSSVALLALRLATPVVAQSDNELTTRYRAAAMESGDADRGKVIFESKEAACRKCHTIAGSEQLAGPNLAVIGDKYTREQLVVSVLEPNASIHPDYAALTVVLKNGTTQTGVMRRRSDTEIELFDAEGKTVNIPLTEFEEEQRSTISLMPSGLFKTVTTDQFADLIWSLVLDDSVFE